MLFLNVNLGNKHPYFKPTKKMVKIMKEVICNLSLNPLRCTVQYVLL